MIVVRVCLSHCERQRYRYGRCSIFGKAFSVGEKAGVHSQVSSGMLKYIRRIQSAQKYGKSHQ